ncbi:MAG TPA: amidase [Gemmataceae bacterium]|nr:amidase [Gemmataceae bacterium]
MSPTFTLHESAAALRRHETSTVDLVHQCLAQIDRYEPRVHAWVSIDRDGALRQAETCDRELAAGQDRGPLHGMPLGVKDIIDVADWPTAAGSRRWAQSIAREDAAVVRNLRAAGAIFLGKTVTTAFASFDPPITRNPWNLERTPGGSSSGSAAALATGMCLGALGSQTGGSITRPASYCGVCGMKPTFGTAPLAGIVPLAASLDHPGPLARCVRDLRLLLEPIVEFRLFPDALVPEHPLRLGRALGLFERDADASVRTAMEEILPRLRRQGIEIVDVTLPASFEEVGSRHRTVMAVEAATWHRERFARHPDDYPPHIRRLIEEGLSIPATRYAACKIHQQELSREMDRVLGVQEMFLLTPAATSPAPAADSTGNPAFNSPWSYTGLPTVSMPTGQFVAGLPLAIQLVGPRFEDSKLLAAAERVEAALAAPTRFPPF